MSVEPSISLVLLGSCYNYFGASPATIFSNRRSSRHTLFEAQIAARRVPAYFAVWQPRVTDWVLILIAEQSKAGLRDTSRTNFSHCVNDDFGSPQFAGSDYTDPGCFSSQSFWKAGSARKGSHIGSNLRSAGVIGIP